MTDSNLEIESIAQKYFSLRRNGRNQEAAQLRALHPESDLRCREYDEFLTLPFVGDQKDALLLSRFRVIGELGRGTYGIVYEVVDTQDKGHGEEPIALKILNDDSRIVLFDREKGILSRLSHSHIVPLLSAGETDEVKFLCMKKLDGSLKELHRLMPSDSRCIADRFVGLADALSILGSIGIHRDIKPDNILVERNSHHNGPKLYLADFGIAKAYDAVGATASHELRGTLGFMAPEQLKHNPIDKRTDIYGLGATLYWCFTKKSPTDAVLLRKVPAFERDVNARVQAADNLIPIRDFHDSVDPDLEFVIMKCLQYNPKDRYPNAGQLRDDLQRVVEGRSPTGRKWTVRGWLRRAKRRYPKTVTLVSLTILLLSIVGFAKWWNMSAELALKEEIAEQNSQLSQKNIELETQYKALEQKNTELGLARNETEDALLRLYGETAERYRRDGFFTAMAESVRKAHDISPGIEYQLQLAAAGSDRFATLVTHDGPISAVLCSRTHGLLVSASHDGRLLVSRLSDGKLIQALDSGSFSAEFRRHWLKWDKADQPHHMYSDLAWLDEGTALLATTVEGQVFLFSIDSQQRREVAKFSNAVNCIAVSSKEQSFHVGCSDGRIFRHSLEDSTTTLVASMNSECLTLCETSTGQLVGGSIDGELLLIQIGQESPIQSLLEPGPIRRVRFNDDANLLALATGASTPIIYQFENGQVVGRRILQGTISDAQPPGGCIVDVSLAESNEHIVGATEAGCLIRWSLKTGQPDRVTRDQNRTRAESFWYDIPLAYRTRFRLPGMMDSSNELIYGARDGCLKRWVAINPQRVKSFSIPADSVIATDSDFDSLLWEGEADGNIRIWDLATGRMQYEYQGFDSRIMSIETLQGSGVVAATERGTWRTFRSDGAAIQAGILYDQSCSLRSAAANPQGDVLALLSNDNQIQFVEIETGKKLARCDQLMEVDGAYQALAFDCDGEELILVGPANQTAILSAVDYTTVRFHKDGVVGQGRGAAAVPDCPRTWLITDAIGRVVRTTPTSCQQILSNGTTVLPALAVSWNGHAARILTVDSLGTIGAWSFPSRQVVATAHQVFSSSITNPSVALKLLPSATSQFLILQFDDGRVEVKKTGREQNRSRISTERSETVLSASDRAVFVGQSCVLADTHFVVWVSKSIVEEQWDVWVTSLNLIDNQTLTRSFGRIVVDRHDAGQQTRNALGISARRGELVVTARDRVEGWSARVLLYSFTDAQFHSDSWGSPESAVISEGVNIGFYPQISQTSELPLVRHFSHDGHYLNSTVFTGQTWTTERLGVQGDGFDMEYAESPSIRWTAFQPKRTNRDTTAVIAIAEFADGPDKNLRGVICQENLSPRFRITQVEDDLFLFAFRPLSALCNELITLRVSADPISGFSTESQETVLACDSAAQCLVVAATTTTSGQPLALCRTTTADRSTYFCTLQSGNGWKTAEFATLNAAEDARGTVHVLRDEVHVILYRKGRAPQVPRPTMLHYRFPLSDFNGT